jgi:hypothetical protein
MPVAVVDYRLLHRFEASWDMETALRKAAAGVAAQRGQLVPDEELFERPVAVVSAPVLRLWLAEDDR